MPDSCAGIEKAGNVFDAGVLRNRAGMVPTIGAVGRGIQDGKGIQHMVTVERIRQLEDEVEYLKAIVDGSEAQTREAVACVLGLLMSFFKEKGVFDYAELISFLAAAADPNEQAEDHNGKLIHDMRRVTEFHRDSEAGLSKTHVPVNELLSAEEIAGLARRAKAQVAFDKDAKKEAKRKGARKTKGAQSRGTTPIH